MYIITHFARTDPDDTSTYYEERPFYSPSVGPYLENPKLYMEANRLTTLEFTVYPDHPEYDRLRLSRSVFFLYRDGTLILMLRPIKKKLTFSGGTSYSCEELGGCLDDLLVRPYPTFHGTIAMYIGIIISDYVHSEASLYAFEVGTVSTDIRQADFLNNDYNGCYSELQDRLVEPFGGFLRFRYAWAGGESTSPQITVYVDYLTEDDLPACSQAIEFGKNMADIFIDTDVSGMFNAVIPLGKENEDSTSTAEQPVYKPTTISSVNSGKDYLEDAASVAEYGRREMVYRWGDVDDPSVLKQIGQQHLNDLNTMPQKTITLTSADLHNLNVSVSAFSNLQRVTVRSAIHGVNETYTITCLEIPLGAPDLLSLTLGMQQSVMTDRVVQTQMSTRNSGLTQKSTDTNRAASSQKQRKHETDIIRNQHGIKKNVEDIAINTTGLALVVDTTVQPNVIKATDIVTAINNLATNTILASRLDIDGIVSALSEKAVTTASLTTGSLTVSDTTATWGYVAYVESAVITMPSITLAGTDKHWFHYEDDGTGGTTAGAAGKVLGRLVSNVTNGSASVTQATKWFLVKGE